MGVTAGEEFDYVIVGAGTAGCVLANRLTEDGKATVALIEAGSSDAHPYITMPAAFTYAISSDRFDWGYSSAPEPHLDGRAIPCPRGRVLGGSSSVNAMAFVRGQHRDYDEWAAGGLVGWAWADCLPYFKRVETFSGGADALRGDDGPLHVTRPIYSTPLNARFLAACAEAGYRPGIDTNGASQEGFGPMDQTIHHGRRESAARAYLAPAKSRANLRIFTSVLADRVRLEGGRAAGVEVLRDGRRSAVTARREVILSAGAIGSPAILQRSGIGDASALRSLGISVAVDRPAVGRDLQDHVDVSFKQIAMEPVTVSPELRLRNKARAFLRWWLFKTGPVATNHFEVAGYIRSSAAADRPDVQICFIPLLVDVHGKPVGAGHGYQMTIMGLRPASRGAVTLTSADPAAAPGILFNYLSREEDIAPLRDGIRRVREIVEQPAFASLKGQELEPGEALQSDRELDGFIRQTAKSTHHPCGTCRMGADAGSVVDPQARVRGVAGLRVVDASIMPRITSGNINAPVFMLAEKLADAIRGIDRGAR
ncbi:MAG TPA: choline dehydrogenase [Dongiaceae bacterium]|nr:choline dehydrogenase [Dongiaceae bacterium]